MCSQTHSQTNAEVLWKQYVLFVDLYKFYFELSVKVSTFYYGITGAVLTYYFQDTGPSPVRYALLVPIAFSLVLGGLYIYAAGPASALHKELGDLGRNLKLESVPDVRPLGVYLRGLGAITLLIGMALAVLFLESSF